MLGSGGISIARSRGDESRFYNPPPMRKYQQLQQQQQMTTTTMQRREQRPPLISKGSTEKITDHEDCATLLPSSTSSSSSANNNSKTNDDNSTNLDQFLEFTTPVVSAQYLPKEFTEPTSDKLLPDLHPQEQHVFTLVLDLNETLLYTDWKRERGWRTFKRPGVDAFLEHMAKFYQIVVYSDQMNMYVDPVCERLDPNHYIRYRLSRGATKYQDGKHYRDLSKLNRDPAKILYVSAHAFESSLQP